MTTMLTGRQDHWLPDLKMTWLLVLAGLITYLLYKVFSPRKREPPGPTGVGLFCNVFKAMKGGTLHLLGEKWARQYGDIVMCRTIIGNFCFLNSARLVRQVFTDKGTELVTNDRPSTFTGATVFYNFKDVVLCDGIKSSDWSKTRKILHSTLKFYGDKLEGTLQTELCRLCDALKTEIKMSGENDRQPPQGNDIEIDHLLSISIRRVLATLVTGEDQDQDSKVPQLIEDLSLCLQKLSNPTTDFLIHTYPFFRFLPGSYYKDLCGRTLKNRDDFVKGVFTKGKANHVPGEPKGMVGSLLEEQINNSSRWLTDDHIRALLLDIIGAGYVTSAELLKSFFLYMVHYPRAMKRIQREIDSVLGHKEPCFDDRKKLPFTEAAILEVLRAASFAPLAVAHETREDIVIGDFFIPRGTMLFENIWWMNRDPTAWEEPNVFRPERFLDDEGQLLPPTHPTRLRFLPFGIGKRSCPGENFARSRAFLYVTTLLQKFDFLPPVNHDLLPLTQDSWTEGVVLQLKPYHVTIKKRSQ